MSPGIERRRFPRIDAGDQIRVLLDPPGWPLHLLEISGGGFSAASPEPFPVDRLLEFRFVNADGTWSTALSARVVYSLRRKVPEHYPIEYVCGFEFVKTPFVMSTKRIEDLLDHTPPRLSVVID